MGGDGVSGLAELDHKAIATAQSAYEITADLESALLARYPAPEWLTVTKIRCGERQLDAVAVRMWSRAYVLAFEIKASRGDWLREMKQPEKADASVGLVDEFWLVTAPNVAKLEEIPEHWGWICQQANGKLRQVKRAPQLPTTTTTDQMTFWASMLGHAWRSNEDRAMQEQAISEARRRGYDDATRRAEERARLSISGDRQRLEEADRIKKALGLASVWEIERHAETIRAVIAGESAMNDIKALRDQAQRVVERIDRAMEGMKGKETRIVIDQVGAIKEVSA